jgi:hypothetical protein
VLKLSRKSLQVWFTQLGDERRVGPRKGNADGGFLEGDVCVVEEGRESAMFTRMFLGWE